jgi:AraC family transcriptional regulator of adaptative response / DNA-3-methyladenine glycosylase II
MASADLDFGYGDDLPGLEAKLLPLAGVGPWTVGYVAMRVLGAPDVFLANDAAVRNGIRALPPAVDDTQLSLDFREVSPWRSYATMHLWRAAAQASARVAPGARTSPEKKAKQ